MSMIIMQTLLICVAMMALTLPAAAMTQKDFHKRLTMAQITALSLDHLLQTNNAQTACNKLYGIKDSNTNRGDLKNLRTRLNDNMESFTTEIMNEYYMVYRDQNPDTERFFDVNREKAKAFESINREKLETEKEAFYPYLKASKFFSKTACETGQPWPETLSDIRAEMDALPALKPLGKDFQTTYRSLLQ